MKKALAIVTAAVLVAGSLAQTASAQPRWGFHRWWDGGEKNPSAAALLDLLPPSLSLGHFYAGDWQGGLLFSAGETLLGATAAGVALYESSRLDSQVRLSFPAWSDTAKAVFLSAVVGYVGLKFWSAYDAAVRADEYNAKLKTGEIRPFLEENRVGVSFTGKF
jgi:hypothetical protein